MNAFEPEIQSANWCVDADSNPPKLTDAVRFVFRTGTGIFYSKVIKPESPQLMELFKEDAHYAFRRALIHPEKYMRSEYQVT